MMSILQKSLLGLAFAGWVTVSGCSGARSHTQLHEPAATEDTEDTEAAGQPESQGPGHAEGNEASHGIEPGGLEDDADLSRGLMTETMEAEEVKQELDDSEPDEAELDDETSIMMDE